MNFKQALKELIYGKKIKRRCWEEGHYWYLNEKGILVNSIGENPTINKHQLIEENDWEVLEEKTEMRKLNIKKDRAEIARIILINLPLMNRNKQICQEVADAILCYLMGDLE